MPRTVTLDDLRRKLQERRHKMTPQRQSILQIFIDRPGEHLRAEDVHDILRDNRDGFGLATVYRSLELLTGLGLLAKLELGDGRSRFELNTTDPASHNHHHLICLGCGAVTEFNEDLLDDLEESIEAKSGFTVLDHQVKFFGYCQNCQNNHDN